MESPSKASLSNRYFFTKGTKASDDYNAFWIRYRPERVFRYKLGRHRGLARSLLVAFLALTAGVFWQYGWQPALYMVVGLLACWLLVKLHFLLYPTHIALTDEGIQIHWLRSFCNISSPLIGWERLTHVSIDKKGKGKTVKKALEFNVMATGMNRKQRLAYQLVAPELTEGWMTGDRGKLRVDLDGIASSDDRKRLQLALKRFLPTYRIEPSVSDELNLAIRVETYTDLWLDALHTSGRRLRDEALPAGTHLKNGTYEIVGQIGAGGQAIVYEAVDSIKLIGADTGKRTVVLKEFVLPAHAGVNVRKRVLEHIQREADMLRNLKHPNVVKLQEFFVEDQRAYLVLERIKGDTLKDLVDNGGIVREEQCVLFAMQMSEILSYLHSQNVIHRDFTPDNLIVAHGDILKLIDFNVAQQLEGDEIKSVVGKHAYIPPEQFRGKAVQQSDIYALGGTLFFLLTGEEPEPISASHPRAVRPDVSTELDAIIAKATAVELKDRYQSCSELRADLQVLKDKYS